MHRVCTRVAVVTIIAMALLIQVPFADGHSPVQGQDHYADWAVDTYKFESDVPSWMQSAFNTAAQSYWPTNLDSRAPRWSFSSSSSNLVSWLTNRNQTGDPTECDPTGAWTACAWYDANGRWGAIEYVSSGLLPPAGVASWCELTQQTGCQQVKRVALHEFGHIAGLARASDGNSHPGSSTAEAYTVMKLNTPLASAEGWNDNQLGVCDLIELQREYQIDSFSSGYADCVDHFAGGISNGKLTTQVTMKVSATDVCVGTGVSFSGVTTGSPPSPANLNYDSHLNRLAGNPLQGRTIALQRNGTTVATTTVSSTGAWSITHSSPAGLYTFTARFAGETALDSDTSNAINVSWSSPC